ncbi:putative uncharacterized protein DDB_G0286901 [Coccinella septempunctata]|uniref:putative uncharacterized protein DDB_G0286901 n=1 Tax=Coccinella septempunctata TaxID=41139 RepID=UPI001D0722B7|nr:putative uncharacterized protein DDB_G0286901 [Coccinella septempunctata]
MMSLDLLQIKKLLRSILISSQIVLDVSQLNEDFKELEGIDIPYEKMGFKTLLDFLCSITDVLLVDGDSMYSKVHQVHSEKSAHVKEMVKKQRPSTKLGRFSSKKIRNEQCERLSRDNIEQIESSDVGKQEYLDNYDNATNSNFTFEDNTQLENNCEGNSKKLYIVERDPFESFEDVNEYPKVDITQSSSIVIKNFNFIDDDLLEMSTNSLKNNYEEKNLLYNSPTNDNFNFEINSVVNIEHDVEENSGNIDILFVKSMNRKQPRKPKTSSKITRKIPKVISIDSIQNSSQDELNEHVSINNLKSIISKPPIRNTRKKRNVSSIKDTNKEQKVSSPISKKKEVNNIPRIFNDDQNFVLPTFESTGTENQENFQTDKGQNVLNSMKFVQNTQVGIKENVNSNDATSKVTQNEQMSRKSKKQFSRCFTLDESETNEKNKEEYFEEIPAPVNCRVPKMRHNEKKSSKSPSMSGDQHNKNSSTRRSFKKMKERNLVDSTSGEVKKEKIEIQDYSEQNSTFVQIEGYHNHNNGNIEELKDSRSEEYRNHQIVNIDLELEFSSGQKIGDVRKNSPIVHLQAFAHSDPYSQNGNLKIPEMDVNTPEDFKKNHQNKVRKSTGQPQNRRREILNNNKNKRNNSQIVNLRTSQRILTNKQTSNSDTNSVSKKFQSTNRRKNKGENGFEIPNFVQCFELKTSVVLAKHDNPLRKNQNEQKKLHNVKGNHLNKSKCDNKSNSRSFNKERQNDQNNSISNVEYINVSEKQEEKIGKKMSIYQEEPTISEISYSEQKENKKQLVASKQYENILKRVIPYCSDIKENCEDEEIVSYDKQIIGRISRRIETKMCRQISDPKKNNHKKEELGELNDPSLRSNIKKQIDTRILKQKHYSRDFYFEQNNVGDSKINGRVSRRVYLT